MIGPGDLVEDGVGARFVIIREAIDGWFAAVNPSAFNAGHQKVDLFIVDASVAKLVLAASIDTKRAMRVWKVLPEGGKEVIRRMIAEKVAALSKLDAIKKGEA